ncbi:MAG TPA: 23S rRNA (adenine(2503)-C(2))-methyltransferase RlmN [Edaphobacter sp.]|jgi:23S rRNA (adenine2503-C2)-methyltransferase|nr:23S rRNA (adenine(2503)-C(2))-methyltransferase RlmN [Edaphobacter sp.]
MNNLNKIIKPTVEEKSLFGLSLAELTTLMEHFGQRPYRASQLHHALYRERITTLDQATTLPQPLRDTLAAGGYTVGLPEIIQTARSIDGTERYLIRMADGETVETVWMPDGDGGERGDGSQAAEEEEAEEAEAKDPAKSAFPYRRSTICVSSQVGCAVNCQFCLTAKLGIRRNLTPGEIAGQVAAVLNRHQVEVGSARGTNIPARINLVFMGMGEPFLNYANFIAAVRLLTHMPIPESRMTVSTSGILPGILEFAKEPVRPKLAVSLNASNDTVRESIMPITRKWNIAALLDALATIPLRNREWITFEYVLLGGINDSLQHADELIALVSGTRCKINLIVWNSGPDMPFHEPSQSGVSVFQRRIMAAGIPAYIRRPRGRDIFAACGQLKRTVETTPLLEIAAAT